MTARPGLGWGGRWIAAILAAVWIGGGAATVVLLRQHWLAIVAGVIAVAYGLLWVEVTRSGRRISWPRRRLHP